MLTQESKTGYSKTLQVIEFDVLKVRLSLFADSGEVVPVGVVLYGYGSFSVVEVEE